jgi:DMSO/TMAO reductase YedYZ molybdopterin-dependent catalytic subunit
MDVHLGANIRYNHRQDRIMNRTVSICVMFLQAVIGLHAQVGAAIMVTGIGGKSVTLSVSDLSKLPQQTVKVTDHGTPVTFEGVLLTDVLAQVDLPTGEKFHKTAASYYLLVEARDGYRALFAWAELDSAFMDKSVYVATKRDGKPLPEKNGPFQLVAPGEKRGGRWIRQVTTLTIKLAS